MSVSDELDINWEEEKLRRQKSYESLLSDVGMIRGCGEMVDRWNGAKIKEWSKKFREITNG
jgi:hypothetical protein